MEKKDIAPELLEKIQSDFKRIFDNNKKIVDLYKRIQEGTATYKELNEFAIETGEILAKAFKMNLSSAVLPEGKMYFNIANRIIPPTLRNNYELVAEVGQLVQKKLNESAGIGIRAIKPEINQDRIEGIVNKIAVAESYDDVAWVLDEPVVNFTQSIVDDFIRENADFQYKSGMTPKIIRTAESKCCEWCSKLEGKYTYPDVPGDVYRRHERCRCTVDYNPGDGKIQNVHTKKWRTENEDDIIKLRKTIGLPKEFDTAKCKHNVDGTLEVSRVVERKLPEDAAALEVIDVISTKNTVSRTIYDEDGKRAVRIDTTDHGFPKHHPMGAHKHIMVYDENGKYQDDGVPMILTKKDRKENADIL